MTIDTRTPEVPSTGTRSGGNGINRRLAVLAGLVAVGLTVAVAELLAAIGSWAGVTSTATSSSPLFGLGSTFIQFTPEWLKHLAIQMFGVYDKVALKTGMGLTLAALAAILGLLALRTLRVAQIVYAVLGLVVAVAVYSRSEASLVDVVPTVVGVGAGLWLLTRMFTGAPAGAPEAPAESQGSRRRFLALAGGGAGAAVVAGGLSRIVPTSAGAESSQLQAANSTASIAVEKMPALPAGASLDVPDISSFVTPNADFYRIDTAFTVPRLNADTWQLRIHGMVDKEISLSYDELLARPQLEKMITLTCVSNEVGGDLVGNAVWQGTLIRDLLAEAGPSADADMVMSRSDDGFSAGTPLSVLTDENRDSIFAITMNGSVLPFEHGFPVRMVVPGLYGYVSATKWVTELEVTRFDRQTSYWTDRGWSPEGPIKTASRIDVPRSFQKFPAGQVVMGGVAWAQHRGIRSVEVQIDGGAWEMATLSTEVTTDTWRQWTYVWDATPGSHNVACRATDSTGAVQDSAIRTPIPDGSTGYDSTAFTVE
ncbi:molybdopterin-dependent oxidoreductase [Nakamurella deserti]|uniref:molybdopterin-dependent oxidoreductase n=1 Tax=Nakamurella deserti TaxID=2164074 RepID=UPI000DBE18A1|nr:molybdopterin-dependent oxidoreductase [Nakamurella deserti]